MGNGRERMKRLKEILEAGEEDITYTQAILHFADVGMGIYEELGRLKDLNTEQFNQTTGRIMEVEDRIDVAESRLDKAETRVTIGVGLTTLVALISAILIATGAA